MNIEYTQGICNDGAAILKNGKRMTIEEILSELSCGQEGKIPQDVEGFIADRQIYGDDPFSSNLVVPVDDLRAWMTGHVRVPVELLYEIQQSIGTVDERSPQQVVGMFRAISAQLESLLNASKGGVIACGAGLEPGYKGRATKQLAVYSAQFCKQYYTKDQIEQYRKEHGANSNPPPRKLTEGKL